MKVATKYQDARTRRDFKPLLKKLVEEGRFAVTFDSMDELATVQSYIYRLVERKGYKCTTKRIVEDGRMGIEVVLA